MASTPMAYGDGLADRLRAAASLDAFIDCHGGGYVKLAIEAERGERRIDTITDFAAAQEYGVKTDGGAEGKNCRGSGGAGRAIAAGKLRRADRRDLPARRGPGGLPAARAGAHARQDRPQALTGIGLVERGPGVG